MGADDTSPAANNGGTTSELEEKIIRQVEYYFGDFNLGRDKFLQEQVKLNDGWVPMETMVKFNRLKMLSDDYAVITGALKKSPNKLMEVSEDGTQIRRNIQNPLPESTDERRKEVDGRSLYVKGFKPTAVLDDLLLFFKIMGKKIGIRNAENIHMRRRQNRNFKGSVFVTFASEDDAKTFLNHEDVKYEGTDLLREKKTDYVNRKTLWYKEHKKQKDERRQKTMEDRRKDEEPDVSEDQITRGCLLRLTGLSKTTMREDIKEILEPYGKILFIEYKKGQTEAVVRFEEAVAAEVLEKASTKEDGVKKINVCDTDAVATCLEGDEELDYWKLIVKSRSEMKQRMQEFKKGGRRGRPGRGGGQGRGGGRFKKGKHRHDNRGGNRSVKGERKDDDDSENDEVNRGVKRKNVADNVAQEIKQEPNSEAPEPPRKVTKTENNAVDGNAAIKGEMDT